MFTISDNYCQKSKIARVLATPPIVMDDPLIGFSMQRATRKRTLRRKRGG